MAILVENTLNEITYAGGINSNKPVDFSGSSSVKLPTNTIFSGQTNPTLTISALGTVQNSTPSAAQLLGGVVTQGSSGATGTVTLPLGSAISSAFANMTVGATFETIFANLGGGQVLTITGATGSTVVGAANVNSATNVQLTFVNTGANTWNVYTVLG